jgi:FKBP-type peptidyl-prolyl cis-trans isomerase FkpA
VTSLQRVLRTFWILCPVSLACLLSIPGCGGSPSSPTSSAPFSQTDLATGAGTQAATGNLVTVSYTGWLYDAARTDGKGTQFDSSSNFTFTLGAGRVIRGWDQGVAGMRVGGQRRLVIPPDLAYGSMGAGNVIPPNATLVFDIALLNVQ